MTVSAKGFQKFTAKKIVLTVGEKARIDVTLNVGAITEEVVVTGESVAQVETTSSDLTSTITGKQIDNLVLNGRNFTQLVNLAPGVVSQTGQDDAKVGVYGNVAYSMNGGRTEYNNWELDGGDNMDNGSNATLNVYQIPKPSPNSKSSLQITARNTVATVPAPSKSKPNPVAAHSTAAPSNTCATISSTQNPGKKAPIQVPKLLPTRSTTSATPSAVPFTFPITTTPAKRRPSSSSPKNGAAKKLRIPPIDQGPFRCRTQRRFLHSLPPRPR